MTATPVGLRTQARTTVPFAQPLDPAAYQRHPLHAPDRTWTEINCYVDLWIEVLHALGLDPRPASACALSSQFLGDQWTFLKHDPADLRLLYGVEVGEINVWRSVPEHVLEHLAAGRLLTVEMDSWWLPDTAGVSYRLTHDKSTVVPVAIDTERRTMTYFHNAGLFELAGEDFDGVFSEHTLVPYVEAVTLDHLQGDAPLVELAQQLVADHLQRRADTNPVEQMRGRLLGDLPWLTGQDAETFHVYSFGMLRQCGGAAALLADLADWFTDEGRPGLEGAGDALSRVAELAKVAQFQLARMARGRAGSLDQTLDQMAEQWELGIDRFAAWHE